MLPCAGEAFPGAVPNRSHEPRDTPHGCIRRKLGSSSVLILPVEGITRLQDVTDGTSSVRLGTSSATTPTAHFPFAKDLDAVR